jgi:choline dehydrogenase-like flavoprotein
MSGAGSGAQTSAQPQALVIGSGFGGAAATYAFSRAGLRTLILEKGDWPKRDAADWHARTIMIDKRYRNAAPMLVRQYRAPEFKETVPFLEEVVGGMSVFYGGATLRMRETDFMRWPIAYRDLEPWYTRAEQLLEVHGEAGTDPCEPWRSTGYPYSFRAHPLVPLSDRIRRAATTLGYRPFRVPLALNIENRERSLCIRCGTCDGFPCAIGAKNDATTLIRHALRGPVEIRTRVIVRRLVVDACNRVTGVECIDGRTGERFTQPAPGIVVLAAGTLQSPAVLLRSRLDHLPQHPLVGANLMRHCNAFVTYAFPFETGSSEVFHKQLCFTDFYEDLRGDLGTSVGIIQDMCMPPAEVVKHYAPTGLKTVASVAAKYLLGLLCVAEDEPQLHNRVTLDGRRDRYGLELLKVAHEYSEADLRRCNYLVDRARRVLRRSGGLPANVFKMDSFAHGVGTLRFGDRPEAAVLDRHCRLFGAPNLFVLDGSFMPTSAGVNPSLTIVANSLRVADHAARNYGELAGAA